MSRVSIARKTTKMLVRVELDIEQAEKHEGYVIATLERAAKEIEAQCRRGFRSVDPLDF